MGRYWTPFLVLAMCVQSGRGAEIRAVLAHPVFLVGYACVEHGEESATWDLGDAFGTDCFIEKLVDVDGRAWAQAYRGSGKQNQDWYGWQQEVLSPCACKVLAMNINLEPNRPGVMGSKPASLLKLQRADGVIFHIAHFDKPLIKVGDSIEAGQVIARVGNNGLAHHPHIHIGAYQGSEPLQIRFDQHSIRSLERVSSRECRGGFCRASEPKSR